MSDQSKLGLGQIITTEQHRDAISASTGRRARTHFRTPWMRLWRSQKGAESDRIL